MTTRAWRNLCLVVFAVSGAVAVLTFAHTDYRGPEKRNADGLLRQGLLTRDQYDRLLQLLPTEHSWWPLALVAAIVAVAAGVAAVILTVRLRRPQGPALT